MTMTPEVYADMQRADQLVADGQLAEAQALYESVYAQFPDQPFPVIRLAEMATRRNDLALAVQYYERAVMLQPEHPRLRRNAGIVLKKMGQNERAAEQYRQAIRHTTDPAELLELKSMLYYCVTPQLDRIVHRFDHNSAEYDAGHIAHADTLPANSVFARLHAHCMQAARAVDLGSGSGQSGLLLRPMVDHLTGVDVSPKMLQVAAAKGIYDRLAHSAIPEFLQAEPAGSYDIIFSSAVIIYFDQLDTLLQAMSHALAPRGLIAFDSTDTDASGTFVVKSEVALQHSHNPAYIVAAAERAGLALVERSEHLFSMLDAPEPSSVFIFTPASAPRNG